MVYYMNILNNIYFRSENNFNLETLLIAKFIRNKAKKHYQRFKHGYNLHIENIHRKLADRADDVLYPRHKFENFKVF